MSPTRLFTTAAALLLPMSASAGLVTSPMGIVAPVTCQDGSQALLTILSFAPSNLDRPAAGYAIEPTGIWVRDTGGGLWIDDTSAGLVAEERDHLVVDGGSERLSSFMEAATEAGEVIWTPAAACGTSEGVVLTFPQSPEADDELGPHAEVWVDADLPGAGILQWQVVALDANGVISAATEF